MPTRRISQLGSRIAECLWRPPSSRRALQANPLPQRNWHKQRPAETSKLRARVRGRSKLQQRIRMRLPVRSTRAWQRCYTAASPDHGRISCHIDSWKHSNSMAIGRGRSLGQTRAAFSTSQKFARRANGKGSASTPQVGICLAISRDPIPLSGERSLWAVTRTDGSGAVGGCGICSNACRIIFT
jgi:hypothetical protein